MEWWWRRTWQEEANADQHEQAEWKHVVAHDVATDAVQVLGGDSAAVAAVARPQLQATRRAHQQCVDHEQQADVACLLQSPVASRFSGAQWATSNIRKCVKRVIGSNWRHR